MPALVDVIIPVFNGSAYLEDALGSIQRQTVADIRLIVVDDGSWDATPQILGRIAASDPRVLVLTTPNQGIVGALNLALAQCSADYVARHDADDLAYPDRFSAQLSYFEDHPGCVALSGTVRHIDERGEPVGSFGRVPRPENADPRYVPAVEPYLIHPFLMMRRTAVTKAGGYRHVLHSEDTDLYWRLRDIGELHNIDRVLGDYRLHAGSISGNSLENGRIMAVSSQLSALSCLRRQNGKPDIPFEETDYKGLRNAASSLQSLCNFVSPKLTPEEQTLLKIDVSAKILELTGYRPYEVAIEDCDFLRSAALESLKSVEPQNRGFLIRRYSGTVARLAHKRLYREARALVWPAILPASLYRFGLRFIFPPDFRASVKKVVWPRLERLRTTVKGKMAQKGRARPEPLPL